MALDVMAASSQVQTMAGALAAQAARMRMVPGFAAELLRTWHARSEEAQAYLEGLETGGIWPFAVPLEPLLSAFSVRGEPRDYAVMATDGSQIDADSHGMVRCLLINVGWAVITYGVKPHAWLSSRPTVHFRDEDLYREDEDGQQREMGDQMLGLLRTVAELERLADLAAEWREREDLVAVADGNLVRWEFGGRNAGSARTALLTRYTSALARFRRLGVPVCSYISRPNSREVANSVSLLALRDCGHTSDRCSQCAGRRPPLCESLRVLNDAQLLTHLRSGQRSALFRSLAPILQNYEAADRVLFCYLKLEDETARIEIPRWAAAPEYLSRVLSAVYGQCLRGRGYPVVLQEAHEQAVIHGPAREAFRRLVQTALVGEGLEPAVSLKRLSKDLRAV
ncbi:MAG TPA: DNA double-strand break repair nuclease NurA [Chloroflexota bacterium]|nr:DNA double-strand break repair nuclease NurA [Chloroflexota bacterium]